MDRSAERQFSRQISRYKPRISFVRSKRLVFRRHLGKENRAIIWVHKDRHAEIERLADATGLTMTQVSDILIRFAMSNIVVITDEGKDVELKAFLDDALGVQVVDKEAIEAEQAADTEADDKQD